MLMTPVLEALLKNSPEGVGFRQHYLTLYSIVYGLEAKNVLEVGAGYSTYTILGALADLNQGALTTVDKRTKENALDKYSPNYYNLEARLTYIQGTFMDQIDRLKGPYDLFMHDGSHKAGDVCLEVGLIASRMRQNGLILVHDTMVLVKGDILAQIPVNFESVTLPYGYGLTIIRILDDQGHGKIDPKWRKM